MHKKLIDQALHIIAGGGLLLAAIIWPPVIVFAVLYTREYYQAGGDWQLKRSWHKHAEWAVATIIWAVIYAVMR